MQQLDITLFRFIHNLSGGWFDPIGLFFAGLAIVVAVAAALIPVATGRKWGRSLKILIGAGVAFLISEMLKILVHRPRPPFALRDVHALIIKDAHEWSFPSGHTSVAFAVAFGLWYWNRTVGAAALVLAILIGLSRVYVGVHYPSDILGGVLVAYLSVLFCKRSFMKKSKH